MNARTFILLIGFCIQLHGQNFVNLDFESANLPVLPAGQFGGRVSVTDGLPGWQVFYGTNFAPVSTMLHNGNTLGDRNISIFGPNFSSYPIIEGQFMPFLQSGGGEPGGLEIGSVTLEQAGLVPNFAQSLQFKVGLQNQIGFGRDTNFFVSLNGQTLSLVPLGSTTLYALYGVDVTAFSGQVSDLRVTSFATAIHPFNWLSVDSFEFSNIAVPEPGTWALLGLGSALFWSAARRRRK